MISMSSFQKGFSLVEMCIVVLISAFLIGGMYTILIAGNNAWEITRDRTELHQCLRIGLDWMRKDLRQACLSTISGVPADGAWHTSIIFQIPTSVVSGSTIWSSNIQYAIGGAGNQQLLRTVGVQQRVIAQRFSLLRFRRQAASSNVLEISAQVQKNTPQHGLISMTRTTQVVIRN